MNETILTFNVPNTITVGLMVLVMFLGVSFAMSAMKGKGGMM